MFPSSRVYPIETILKIEKERKYPFRLSNETIQLFKSMVADIGAPPQQKAKKDDEQWETVRKSKQQHSIPTKIQTKTPKSKTVSDEIVRKDDKTILSDSVDEIRILLNKMTAKNYTEILASMVKILQAFQRYHKSGLLDETILAKVSEIIFTIATQNRFFSKLYADLFSDLIFQFDFLQSMFDTYATNVIDTFLHVGEYVSEEKYDLFCKLNEENDRRKSLAEFFVNLNKNEIISKHTMRMYCVSVLTRIMSLVKEEGNKYPVDVLVDVLSILYDAETMKEVKVLEEELDFNKCIKKFSKSKATEFASLSRKSIFKFMDMVGVWSQFNCCYD